MGTATKQVLQPFEFPASMAHDISEDAMEVT